LPPQKKVLQRMTIQKNLLRPRTLLWVSTVLLCTSCRHAPSRAESQAPTEAQVADTAQLWVQQYRQFFSDLDRQPILQDSSRHLLLHYELYLRVQAEGGFKSKAEVLDFLRHEDILFRTFLTHLSGLGNTALGPIREGTEAACRAIMEVPPDSLSHEETVVLMTMRSNRRLMQNADTCLADIRRGKVQDQAQASAYLWMLLQPFFTLDDFALEMMTEEQRADFDLLTRAVPKVAERFKRQFPDIQWDVSEITQLIEEATTPHKN
jgi:hypothetical protein